MEWLEAVVADEMPLVGDLDYEGSLRAVASLIDVYIGRPSPARMEDTDLFDEAVQLAVQLWTALGTTGQYAQGTAADTDEALLMTWLLCAGVYDELTEEDMDLARAILPLFDVDNLGTIDTVNGILDAAEALKVEE
ncbi:hypothetical protein ACK3TF_004574 [Chlorella vulgaris]